MFSAVADTHTIIRETLMDTQRAQIAYEQRLHQRTDLVLREASQFLMQRGDLYNTLRGLIGRLEEAQIPYAVIGAIALAQHGLARMTLDIDVLLTKEGLAAFKTLCVGRGYVPAFPGAQKTFRAVDTGVRIEMITTGEYPGDGLPKPVSFPDPAGASLDLGGIRVIALEGLVELKLASGMSAPHRRRDLADIQDLIRALGLPVEFADRLDSSVRALYRQLWEEAHVPDKLQEG